MTPTQKTFLANVFSVAEFEVEDKIKMLKDALGHSSEPGTPAVTADEFKALQDENADLTKRVSALESTVEELSAFKSDMLGLSGKTNDPAPSPAPASTGDQGAGSSSTLSNQPAGASQS